MFQRHPEGKYTIGGTVLNLFKPRLEGLDASLTPKIGLTKLDSQDHVNRVAFNNNANILDMEIGRLQDEPRL